MAIEINDETFVDGTMTAGNIIYGRTDVDGAYSNSVRSKTVVLGQDGNDSFTAGSGDPTVIVTGYTGASTNRLDTNGVHNIGVTSVSASQFTIHVYRTTVAVTTVYWMALRNP